MIQRCPGPQSILQPFSQKLSNITSQILVTVPDSDYKKHLYITYFQCNLCYRKLRHIFELSHTNYSEFGWCTCNILNLVGAQCTCNIIRLVSQDRSFCRQAVKGTVSRQSCDLCLHFRTTVLLKNFIIFMKPKGGVFKCATQ